MSGPIRDLWKEPAASIPYLEQFFDLGDEGLLILGKLCQKLLAEHEEVSRGFRDWLDQRKFEQCRFQVHQLANRYLHFEDEASVQVLQSIEKNLTSANIDRVALSQEFEKFLILSRETVEFVRKLSDNLCK